MVLMVAIQLSPSLATAAEPVLPAGPSLDLHSYLSVIVSLGVVLGLILLAGWLMRRVQRVRRGGSATLEIVDVLPVGPKEKILLVRAGDRRLLIGLTPGRMSALGAVDRAADANGDEPVFRIAGHAA